MIADSHGPMYGKNRSEKLSTPHMIALGTPIERQPHADANAIAGVDQELHPQIPAHPLGDVGERLGGGMQIGRAEQLQQADSAGLRA